MKSKDLCNLSKNNGLCYNMICNDLKFKAEQVMYDTKTVFA